MRAQKSLELLRWTLGVTAFVAGADKFTNLLTDWEQYLAPIVERNLPLSGRDFMRLVGVIEMVVGTLILRGHRRLGGYIAGLWLLGISANLIATGKYFDVAARDVNMAVAALALASLAGERSQELHEIEEERRAA
jgi:uncharacterized membrane protein YphA (DoxX/SURF4 family)